MRFNVEKMQPLGEGAEKKVYIHPEDEDKVVAFFREGPKSLETAMSMKGRFYLTKILHILMPDSIPDIHFASRNDDATLISERKHLGEKYLELSRLNRLALHGEMTRNQFVDLSNAGIDHSSSLDRDSLDSLYNRLKELGVLNDLSPQNLGKDENNDLVYVDNTFRPWRYSKRESVYGENGVSKFYNPQKIRERAQELSEQDRDKVLAYLDRLETLYEEENGAG